MHLTNALCSCSHQQRQNNCCVPIPARHETAPTAPAGVLSHLPRWADGSAKGAIAGEKHERCRPLTDEELGSEEMHAGGWYNKVAAPVLRAADIPIFDAFHETLPLWQFHMWDKDCTHFCFPGESLLPLGCHPHTPKHMPHRVMIWATTSMKLSVTV